MLDEPLPQLSQRLLHASAELVARTASLLLCSGAPCLKRAILHGLVRPAESARVQHEPKHRELREAFLTEDPLQVRLEPCRPGQARVVATYAQHEAVGDDAPECAVGSVQV